MKNGKAILLSCICMTAGLLFHGCAAESTEQPKQAALSIEEQTPTAAADDHEDDMTDDDIKAMLKEKRESMSKEDYIVYMEDRAQKMPLPESARYNYELDEYYDSNVQEWDEEAHTYRHITASVQGYNPLDQYEERPFTGTIPEELDSALKAYDEADAKAVQDGPPDVSSAFHVGFALPEYQRLQELTVPYIDCVISLASTDQAYRVLAQCLLEPLTQYTPPNSCGAEYEMKMQTAYQEASDAVSALGEKITAEDAAALQETYGYMIAPALQDIGKLDLLQIDPDSPCQDAEKLAEFARYFA